MFRIYLSYKVCRAILNWRTGVHRIAQGYRSDIMIDAVSGDILSDALATLAMSLTSTIDVTDLIRKRASMWRAAWRAIYSVLESGAIKPIVARTFALEDAAEALRYQIESRPFGRVVLKI
jgi:NADPH:quinone reductase